MKSVRLTFSVLLLLLAIPAFVAAQSVTQVSPGLAGEKDARGRNPELSVTRVHNDGYISLLVDAFVPHPDYQVYPIEFHYYVNRQFFTSQIRTQELPGAVGVDIGPDIASPPFNYTVIARVLHPHRATHSMVVGAVYSTELSVTLACSVTIGGTTYNTANTNTAQIGNDQFNVDILAEDDSGDRVTVVGTVNLSNTDANAPLQVTQSGSTSTVTSSGTVSFENNTLSGITLESGTFALSCL